MIVLEIAGVVGLGLGLGLLGSIAAGAAMRSLLYGVGAHDPLVTALSLGLLLAAAGVAAAIPASRAARIEPRVALGAE